MRIFGSFEIGMLSLHPDWKLSVHEADEEEVKTLLKEEPACWYSEDSLKRDLFEAAYGKVPLTGRDDGLRVTHGEKLLVVKQLGPLPSDLHVYLVCCFNAREI